MSKAQLPLVNRAREQGSKPWDDMCVLAQCAIEYSGGIFGFDAVLKLFATVSLHTTCDSTY